MYFFLFIVNMFSFLFSFEGGMCKIYDSKYFTINSLNNGISREKGLLPIENTNWSGNRYLLNRCSESFRYWSSLFLMSFHSSYWLSTYTFAYSSYFEFARSLKSKCSNFHVQKKFIQSTKIKKVVKKCASLEISVSEEATKFKCTPNFVIEIGSLALTTIRHNADLEWEILELK